MFLTTNEENQPKKRSRRKRRRRISIFKVLLLFLFTSVFVAGVMVGGYTLYVVKNAAPIDPTKISDLLEDTSFIYDSHGNLLERVSSSRNITRIVVPIEQIPDHLQKAVIAIEDERFEQHNGVDVKRVFGALWHDIKTRSLEQGASTITMQLAKNLYTGPDRSLDRKITDAYNAIQIEKVLSKDQILYYYLNKVNLARGNYGVQAAARHYFNKDVSKVTLAESAMLAAILKNPSKLSVYVTAPMTADENLDNIQIRLLVRGENSEVPPPTEEDQKLFSRLLSKGLISRYDYVQLKNGELYVRKATVNNVAKERQELVLDMMVKNKFITKEERDAAAAEPIIIKIGKNKQSNVSSYFADKVQVETLSILKNLGYEDEEAQDIMVGGGLRIYSTMDPKIQAILENEVNNSANYPRTQVNEEGVLQPQVAAVVMQQSNGFVRGLIGGRGIGGSKIYNRALNPRQPGSSIKPIAVYLPALLHGFTPGSPVDDKPITEGKYRPKNYSTYDGPTTIRNLIIKSSNVGAVRVAKIVGPNVMIDMLQKLGLSTVVTRDINKYTNDENLSLALGGMTYGATPMDMTAAYATIANNGVYTKPIFVKRIETSTGTVVYDAVAETRKVASPQIAYLTTNMLQDVVSKGTGARAKVSGQATAGKTGTTNDEKDVWFVGFTPYYTGTVWIGEDIPKDLNMTSDVPSALWGKIMNKVHAGMASKNFVMPSGIVGVSICDESGELATEYCNRVRKEIFVKGTTPKETCHIHTAPPPEENPIFSEEETEDVIDNTPPVLDFSGGNQGTQPPPSGGNQDSGGSLFNGGNGGNNSGENNGG